MSNLINDIALPDPVFRAMEVSSRSYNPGNTDYSPSTLTIGAKEYWGRKRNKDLKSYASKQWAAFTGTLQHMGLEFLLKGYPDYKQELHLELNFNAVSKSLKLPNDRIIGGTVDLFEDSVKKILWDYKTMSTQQIITDDKIEDWTIRANLYRWMLILSGHVRVDLDDMIYIAIFKDWTTTKAERTRSIEDIPCPSFKLKKWTREQIEQYIYDKVTEIEQHKDTPLDEIPYCSKEERWEKPSVYKVYKITDGKCSNTMCKGAAFESEADAAAYMTQRIENAKKNESYTYKLTGGVPTKCLGWCSLANNGLCDFGKKFKQGDIDAES